MKESVLVVLHGDGFVEVFAEDNIGVGIRNIPHCPGSEVEAEEVFVQSLKPFQRRLYFPGKLKAQAMHRPQKPSSIMEALKVKQVLNRLNALFKK